MDINCRIGQQIYRSIEAGHMVPTATGFHDQDSGWHYDLTNMDYFVRRKPETLQIERIYLGIDQPIPVNALDPDEYLRVGSSFTYDELLYPRTLPMNVKKNVRPGGCIAEDLLAHCRQRHLEVLEHDPAKWPYFEKPFSRGTSSNWVQSPSDMESAGWPINYTRDTRSGFVYGVPAGEPSPSAEATPLRADPTDAERRERRHARWAAEQAAWEQEHPVATTALTALGMSIVVGGICLVGAAVGLAAKKVHNALHR